METKASLRGVQMVCLWAWVWDFKVLGFLKGSSFFLRYSEGFCF